LGTLGAGLAARRALSEAYGLGVYRARHHFRGLEWRMLVFSGKVMPTPPNTTVRRACISWV
jgi:hypothetical protein